jgi:hypothetical protein
MIYFLIFVLLISLVTNIFLFVSLRRAFYTIDVLELWLVDFKGLVNNVYKKLKDIDNRGIFEKDDDVGFMFSDIVNIIKITNERINDDDSDNPTNINEKTNKN